MTEEEKKAMLILNNISVKILSNEENEAIAIIDNLIQKQDTEINKLNNVIDRTTKYIEELIGSCPFDTFDWKEKDCKKECKDQMAECWKEYFIKEDK